jgi:hypothetical protein
MQLPNQDNKKLQNVNYCSHGAKTTLAWLAIHKKDANTCIIVTTPRGPHNVPTQQTNSDKQAVLAVRVPAWIADRLKKRADANMRSLTAEVHLALKRELEREGKGKEPMADQHQANAAM